MRDRARTTLGLARRAWRALGAPDDLAARAELDAYVLDRVVRRPIVFEDGRGLRYVLRPGENARAYLDHDGNYEVAETRFCERYVEPGMTVVDAGAHIGLYTLLFARLVGPEGRVHAFEPAPDNQRRLRENLALNDVGNVHVEHAALFRQSGSVTLHLYPRELGAWHSLGAPTLSDPSSGRAAIAPLETVEVRASTLDEHVREHGLERVDLLKLDVEGAEPDVLAGAAETLAAGRLRAVLFEVSLPQVEAMGHAGGDTRAALEAAGLRVHAIRPDGTLGDPPTGPEGSYGLYGNYVALGEDDRARLR